MKISQEARYISEKTRTELGLLYQFPTEAQMAIDEKRALLAWHQGKVVAFVIWKYYGSWCEISSLYIEPDFRKRGFFDKIVSVLRSHFQSRDKGINFFVFTRHPAVARAARLLELKKTLMRNMPGNIFFKIILNRIHPRRLVSYLKFFKLGLKMLKFHSVLYVGTIKPAD